MRNMTLTCCILCSFLAVHGVPGEESFSAGMDGSGCSVKLKELASATVPLSDLEEVGGIGSEKTREEIIGRSLSRARAILPSFDSLASEDELNAYAVDNVTTNLYILRNTASTVTAGRVPLVASSNPVISEIKIAIWAEPRRAEDGSIPLVWQPPSSQDQKKAWLSGLLTEIVGSKVDVILVNGRDDGTDDVVCRVRTGCSSAPYAKVHVTPNGVAVSISTRPSAKSTHPSPRGSNSEPIEQSPIVFPPGLGPDHSK